MSVHTATPITPRVRVSFYHPELDVLRFCAAIGVVVFHSLENLGNTASLANVIRRSGAYGVDLFFALSAFLITQLLLRERDEQGVLDVRAFYLRRILRIWPLYFCFILFAYIFTFITHHQQKLGGDYIAGFFFLFGNWVFVFHGPPLSIAGPLWSVSLEEQFYLSWPLVVKRAKLETIAVIAGALLVLANLVRIVILMFDSNADAIWFNTFTRLDPLVLGILFALWIYRRDFALEKWQRLGLLVIGSASWILVSYFTSLTRSPLSFWGSTLGYPAVALGSIALLASVYNAPQSGLSIFRNSRLVYLGKISYGIYVFHMLAINIAFHATRGHKNKLIWGIIYSVLVPGLTILFASLSYRFLESPFLRLKERYARVKSRPV